jgi:hypothetical protein
VPVIQTSLSLDVKSCLPVFSAQRRFIFSVKKGELTEVGLKTVVVFSLGLDNSVQNYIGTVETDKEPPWLQREVTLLEYTLIHQALSAELLGMHDQSKHTVHGPPHHSEIGNGSGNTAAVPHASMAQTKAPPNNTAFLLAHSPLGFILLPISSRVAAPAAGEG